MKIDRDTQKIQRPLILYGLPVSFVRVGVFGKSSPHLSSLALDCSFRFVELRPECPLVLLLLVLFSFLVHPEGGARENEIPILRLSIVHSSEHKRLSSGPSGNRPSLQRFFSTDFFRSTVMGEFLLSDMSDYDLGCSSSPRTRNSWTDE